MDAAYHAAGLQKICRVCGESLARAFRVHYGCAEPKHARNLRKVFEIDVLTDESTVHPPNFCHKCQNIIYTTIKRVEDGRDYTPRLTLFDGWVEHTDEACSVCRHIAAVQRGGARKKTKGGRPAEGSCMSAMRHIRTVAPPSFFPDVSGQVYLAGDSPVALSDLECPICTNILDRPIELVTCGSHVCAACCCEWLKVTNTLSCPSCYGDHFHTFSTIRLGSTLVLKLVGGLLTECRECKQAVKVADYRAHRCNTHTQSPSEVRVEDVLQRPLSAPLTPIERQLQSSLARRSMATSPEENNILRIGTGGQVYTNIIHP